MVEILYFSTTWCGPCKSFKPVVQQVALETGRHVTFLDADVNKELAAQHQISSVPTIVVTQGGNQLYRHSGVLSKQQLINLLNTFQ